MENTNWRLNNTNALTRFCPRIIECICMPESPVRLNRRAEAIQQFQEAIQRRPDYWEAVYALGEELAFDKKVSKARQQFEKVLKLKPDYAMAT